MELIWLQPCMYSHNHKRMQLSVTAAAVPWSPVPSSCQISIWLQKPSLTTKNFVSLSERCVRVCTTVRTCSRGCTGGRGQHADRHFPLLSGPISVWQVNGEHKTYLKATFTTWLIPLHCVISRCHISPPHVCLNALPSTLWLVSLGWLPQIHSTRAPHPFTSSLRGKTPYCTFYLGVQQDTK